MTDIPTTGRAPDVLPVQNEQPALASVANAPPVLAEIKLQEKPAVLVNTADNLTKAPETTAEEDLHSASQRKTNWFWELAQGVIAILVTLTACIISIILVIRAEYALALQLTSSMVFMVLSFYFQRLNHSNVGGVQLPNTGRK